MTKEKDSRYPYTYACDYIQSFGGCDSGGVRVSRADASRIRQAVANAIGLPDDLLAIKLADYYLANKEKIDAASVQELIAVFTAPQPA